MATDEDTAHSARLLLAKSQTDLGPLLKRRFEEASDADKRLLLRLASRLSSIAVHTLLDQLFLEGARSEDARVRRAAVEGLGRKEVEGRAEVLAEALAKDSDASVRRRAAVALGKVGGEIAKKALAGFEDDTEAGAAVRAKASMMAERSLQRTETSRVRLEERLPSSNWALRCRSGLEEILEEELPKEARRRETVFGPGVVDVTFAGALEDLFGIRTCSDFCLSTDPIAIGSDAELGPAIARSLVAARKTLARLTEGPIRYRLDFLRSGKHRALVWEIAAAVQKQAPELINDPTESVWDALVVETSNKHRSTHKERLVRLELTPNFTDPRFAYRAWDVAAASHPTIAAALVRVAGAGENDVVWDPFLGSGTELAERAQLGPFQELIGTDFDERAVESAEENLAGFDGEIRLVRADARAFDPGRPVDAIITNPPMGRRVLHGTDIGELLANFLHRAARFLSPKGRLVWLSPAPEVTRRTAVELGLHLTRSSVVDMGGFTAELQRFDRKPR